MHSYLSHKYSVRVLKFASLQPNQNRYEDAYREVRFRTNREFSASAAVQKNSHETSQQGSERVFGATPRMLCGYRSTSQSSRTALLQLSSMTSSWTDPCSRSCASWAAPCSSMTTCGSFSSVLGRRYSMTANWKFLFNIF